MKTAQVTVFVLLGIVMLSIFGFLFYVKLKTITAPIEKDREKILDELIDRTSLKYYVTQCLEQATVDGLQLVGLQGGVLYDYQVAGGKHITNLEEEAIPLVNFTEVATSKGNLTKISVNVSYGIKAQPDSLPPPDYPYVGSLIENPWTNWLFVKNIITPIYTRAGLPYLCETGGPNVFNIKGALNSCEVYSIKRESIQYYLTIYINNKTQECFNISMLSEKTGYNISIGNISSTVTMGENDIFVNLKYPIVMSKEGKPPVIKELDFVNTQNVRLKKINELAYHLIKNPVKNSNSLANHKNIFFDLLKDDPNDCNKGFSCLYLGFERNMAESACKERIISGACVGDDPCCSINTHYRYSHILTITDSESLLRGLPYVFQFAIENRRPALDFIDMNVNSSYNYYWYLNNVYGKNLTKVYNKSVQPAPSTDTTNYSIIVDVGQMIEIFPHGLDPDTHEENLIYHYSGKNIITGVNFFDLESSDYYMTGFSSSALHKIRKDANRTASKADIGSYLLNISVFDSEGLVDWQSVMLKVRCINDPYSQNDCCDNNYDYTGGARCGMCQRCGAGTLNDPNFECTVTDVIGDCPTCYKCDSLSPSSCSRQDDGQNLGESCFGDNYCCNGNCNSEAAPSAGTLDYKCRKLEKKCYGTSYEYEIDPGLAGTTCDSNNCFACDNSGSCSIPLCNECEKCIGSGNCRYDLNKLGDPCNSGAGICKRVGNRAMCS